MQPRKQRIALSLFSIYLVLYSSFVFLNAFAPAAMEATPVAGVNVAILYGFGLIITAFVLALLYGWLAMPPATSRNAIEIHREHGTSKSNPAAPLVPRAPGGPPEDQP